QFLELHREYVRVRDAMADGVDVMPAAVAIDGSLQALVDDLVQDEHHIVGRAAELAGAADNLDALQRIERSPVRRPKAAQREQQEGHTAALLQAVPRALLGILRSEETLKALLQAGPQVGEGNGVTLRGQGSFLALRKGLEGNEAVQDAIVVAPL